MAEFGTVSRLQTNLLGIQDETDTFRRAAEELKQRRQALQQQLEEADHLLTERRATLTNFQFKLESQRLQTEKCEQRAKEAEKENAEVQREVTRLKEAIAEEKKQWLERLNGLEGKVHMLVQQFRQAAEESSESVPDPTGSAVQAEVGQLEELVAQVRLQLEKEQQRDSLPSELKVSVLQDAEQYVNQLKQQVGIQAEQEE